MTEENNTPAPPSTLSKLLPWIVLMLSALGLFYFVDKGCHAPPAQEQDQPVMNVDTMKNDSMGNAVMDTSAIDSVR